MGIKKRITWLFVATAMVLFSSCSVVAYWALYDQLWLGAEATLRETLHHEAMHLEEDLRFHGKAAIGRDIYVQVFKGGQLIHDSLPAHLAGVVGDPTSSLVLREETVVEHPQGQIRLRGFLDLENTRRILATFRNTLLFGNLVLLVFGFPLGLWFTHQSLRPFRDLAQRTSDLGAKDLSFRFPDPVVDDEYGVLTRNFNGLLSRLEKAFATISQFAGRASHELRTPVTAVAGHAEVALRSQRTATEYQETLTTILNRSRGLQELLNRLLLLSRLDHDPQEAPPSPIKVGVRLQELFEMFRDARGRPDAVLEMAGDRDTKLNVNPELFTIALSNAMDNGVKHCQTKVRAAWERGGCGLRLEIHDDGSGIAMGDRTRLLQPFQRGEGGGTGLGLSLAALAIANMGGRMELETSPLGGLLFVVELPS